MIKIIDKPIVYCDVDDTLVLWNKHDVPEGEAATTLVLIRDSMGSVEVWPHKKHIEMLRHFRARGHTIVVWSAGGSDWAETIIKHLKLEDIVDIILPKPTWWIDDLPSNLVLSESSRIWKDPKAESVSRIIRTSNSFILDSED